MVITMQDENIEQIQENTEQNDEKFEQVEEPYYEEPEKESKVDHNKEIREAVASDNAIIGYDATLKALKSDVVAKLFVAKNIPGAKFDELKHYADIVNVEVIKLNIDNEELGILCKKQFMISTLALKKQ